MRAWPDRVFCDTSFFFACLERRDVHHARALDWLERSRAASSAFWTTWDVVGETVTLLRRKAGYRLALDFIDEVLPALHVAPCDESLREEAVEVFRRFGRDKELSYCDCLSCAVLSTVLENVPTATFDRHFKMMGLPLLG